MPKQRSATPHCKERTTPVCALQDTSKSQGTQARCTAIMVPFLRLPMRTATFERREGMTEAHVDDLRGTERGKGVRDVCLAHTTWTALDTVASHCWQKDPDVEAASWVFDGAPSALAPFPKLMLSMMSSVVTNGSGSHVVSSCTKSNHSKCGYSFWFSQAVLVPSLRTPSVFHNLGERRVAVELARSEPGSNHDIKVFGVEGVPSSFVHNVGG